DSDSDTTTTTTTGETTAVADPLVVDCLEPPQGAVEASYSHTPEVSGGVPGYSWSAEGLPDGLAINEFTGQITGAPAAAGDYTIDLTVTDSDGTMAMATCPLVTVADKFSVDLDALDGPCITAGGSLLDYVSGGDGSGVKCTTPGGTGNGKLPAGITVGEESCAIEGTIAETRFGTWAWIVRAEQSDVEIYVPYCATQDQQAPDAYSIVGTHSGGAGDELTPVSATFTPGELLKFDGDGEPRFEITTECGNACFYGYFYSVSSSPFGGGPCKDDADGCYGLCPLIDDPNEMDGDKAIGCTLIPEMGLPKEGFAHEMWAKGDVPTVDYEDRAWILQWGIDYCVSTSDTACTSKDNIIANGKDTNLEFAIIMRPGG
ncbi:MAG: putative Ig domain-containing protein, partial [Myxococcales bacterium]|nr:putative Ig domain-containing protein [Myxococcales bacterium]